jgi:hypothetical protein
MRMKGSVNGRKHNSVECRSYEASTTAPGAVSAENQKQRNALLIKRAQNAYQYLYHSEVTAKQ